MEEIEEVDDGLTTYIGYPTGPKDSDDDEVDDESQQGSRHRRGRGGLSVSAIECNIRLITAVDGKATLYKGQPGRLRRYSPVLKRWVKSSGIHVNSTDISVDLPRSMEMSLVDMVQDLFDTGASHLMIKDARLFKPGTEVKLNDTWATTASGERIKVESVGTVRMCSLALLIPSLVKNLTSLSHIRRSAEWPGQFAVASALSSDAQSGESVDALEVIQYHYQAIDPTHQKFVPYQVIVVAQLANETLYYMPQSWLYKQEHLLQQGEIDPHKFVGRDDRPEVGRWMPAGHHYLEEPEVYTAVLEQGTADIRRRVDSGELLCTDILDPDKLTTYIVDLQTPIWAVLSDAVKTLHRAITHISP